MKHLNGKFSFGPSPMNLVAINRLQDFTNQGPTQILRDLIPCPAVVEALQYFHGGCIRNPDSIDAGMLESVFVQSLIQRMTTHEDYSITLQVLAAQLGTLGNYASTIAALYVKWSKAILKHEGYSFCETAVEKNGKSQDARIVLGQLRRKTTTGNHEES